MDWEELSLGDFVLSGGEIPVLALIEATVRLLPGVLGDDESAEFDSFAQDGLLDHPHYTRPRSFRGMEVPEQLLTGNHAAVAAWRRQQAERLTARRSKLLRGEPQQGRKPWYGQQAQQSQGRDRREGPRGFAFGQDTYSYEPGCVRARDVRREVGESWTSSASSNLST